MKIKKINGLWWAVIEKEKEIFVAINKDFKESFRMCVRMYQEVITKRKTKWKTIF